MQEARAAGCRSSAEVERYIERKRKREVEEGVPRKESSQIGPTSQESCQGNLSSITDSGIAAFSAGELLSEPVSCQITAFEMNSSVTQLV